MTLSNAFKWAGTILASGASLALVASALKSIADLLKTCVETRKNWVEIQLKTVELKNQNSLIVKPTLQEIEKYAVKARAEFQRSFRSVVVFIALFAIAGAGWAAVVARKAQNDAAAAYAALEQTRKQLEQTRKELDDLRNTPKPQTPSPQPPQIKQPPPQTVKSTKREVEEEVVEGPPAIIIRNNYPDQPVVVDVEGTSSSHFAVEAGAERPVPDVREGGAYTIKITEPKATTTAKDLKPQANKHYILSVPLSSSPLKIQRK